MRNIDFLSESNIFNTEEIRAILTDLAKNILDPYKKQFVKSAFTEITNNPKYHTKLTQLPANSPDWAKKAMEADDLFTATISPPDRELLTQIIHWLEDIVAKSIITPSDDTEKQDKISASRQLQSLSRMNLTAMLDHERKWFSRHANLIKGDVSGMEKVLDVGNGWAWWKLVTQPAFAREGQVLKNCIGSNYTAANTKASGTSIYILKNASQESFVAMRVNRQNQMVEVKGHNNRPPNAYYMPMTNKFLQQLQITVAYEGKNDLNGAGYDYDPNTKSIKHLSELYPFEKGSDIGQGYILVKWTAPFNIWNQSWMGNNHVVGQSTGRTETDRYDVVSPKNTYHPKLSLLVSQNKIVGIGYLTSTDRIISPTGMTQLAELLTNAAKALNVRISDTLSGGGQYSPGLRRYGLTIKNGKISTDHSLAIEVSVASNPKSIARIKNPNEKLQMVAVTGDNLVLPLIDNPTPAVQNYAFEHTLYPHKLMNEYINMHNGQLPIESAQMTACAKDGASIQMIPNPPEQMQKIAAASNGKALLYLAIRFKKAGKPAPSDAVQLAAFLNDKRDYYIFIWFVKYYPVSPAVQLAVAKHYAELNENKVLAFIISTLRDADQLDPSVERYARGKI